MQQKNNIFFIKKKWNIYFFAIPLFIISLISLGVLIATGWYQIDYQIAVELAKPSSNEFVKYWVRFYDQLGNTEIVIVIIIYLTILLETWFLLKIKQEKQKFIKNYWITVIYYFLAIGAWLIGNIVNLALIPSLDEGFGPGIDYLLFDNYKYKLTSAILVFLYQSFLLGIGLYYVRYRLVKTNRLLTEQTWIKATKGLSFLISTYIIIVILKGATHRIYYYNAIFGDLIDSHPEFLAAYLKSGFHFGYNLGNGYLNNIPSEWQYPWWKPPIGLFSNVNMPTFKTPWEYAFPSGHINATYCTGSIILLFLKNKQNNKINWKIKLCFIIWLIHVLAMNFAVVMERFHWISDTAFTFIFSATMILVVHFSINKIFSKHLI
ncbi:phosphatase PAP2 family protein [Spiroplasma endosymbiont of Megaselia nigra]|uniref:phosphatase PAP2 family protein n=1 Tax=Spiroplasma endosymbiont of Megaselia nigra TaxID=2478537 RepID=UPI000F892A6E|nr:phosphatase PAP2 family protein [Spiroplasma endosymbiont of Megaselia nigra]RUO85901.1 phosphatase PAP2 family protein [Spiroplasma endosymbiont of Megaselia nigra]